MYLFLQLDYDLLKSQIADLSKKLNEQKRSMIQSTRESSESWHDNAAFEEAERQYNLWAENLNQLLQIFNNARVVEISGGMTVSIGKDVTVVDENGDQKTYLIGSYIVMAENPDTISYASPVASLIMDAKVGDERSGNIGGIEKSFKIQSIK